MTTIVYQGESKWGRPTYLKLVDDKVVYDDSDGEYGPIEFDIALLSKALTSHYYAQPISYEEWHRRRDIMAMEQDRKKQTPERTDEYIDRHIVEAMVQLAKEGYKPDENKNK